MGCCLGTNNDEACGWPKGTVRALIAVITVSGAFAAGLFIVIWLCIQGVYDLATGANSGMFTIIGGVIGYYFGSRSAESATKMISDNQKENMRMRARELNLRDEIDQNIV